MPLMPPDEALTRNTPLPSPATSRLITAAAEEVAAGEAAAEAACTKIQNRECKGEQGPGVGMPAVAPGMIGVVHAEIAAEGMPEKLQPQQQGLAGAGAATGWHTAPPPAGRMGIQDSSEESILAKFAVITGEEGAARTANVAGSCRKASMEEVGGADGSRHIQRAVSVRTSSSDVVGDGPFCVRLVSVRSLAYAELPIVVQSHVCLYGTSNGQVCNVSLGKQ
jgi:hypothetical protein